MRQILPSQVTMQKSGFIQSLPFIQQGQDILHGLGQTGFITALSRLTKNLVQLRHMTKCGLISHLGADQRWRMFFVHIVRFNMHHVVG